MRAMAVKKLDGRLPRNFEYLTADWLTVMKKWQARYDCILCIGNSLSHNPPDCLSALFTAILRVLVPGGIVILNGRRFEQELKLAEGPDSSQNEVCRSGGPACIPELGNRGVLRYMFMTKVADPRRKRTVVTFYTYDNYEQDRRRFVHHRMLFNNRKKLETIPYHYDSWSTRQYYIYEKRVLASLRSCGFLEVKEESPDVKHFKLEKNWYIVARKPRE